MRYNIISTRRFEKELKRLAKKFPSLKNEFAKLIDNITDNPEAGTFIGNNCYKIRWLLAAKEKAKVAVQGYTYLYIETETVYLLTIYDKGEKADLKPNELKEMIESLELD